nr:tetratricopeptide repeat protein [Glycomyces amatae]
MFPGEPRLQKKLRTTLCRGKTQDWPLVDGTDLDDLVSDVHAWLLENDPGPGGPGASSADEHPYLQVLCRYIITSYGFRAENNGIRNVILYPRWSRFRSENLLRLLDRDPPSRFEPRRFGTIPPLAAARQDRPVDARLNATLAEGGAAIQILSGMSGVGKTQIAAACALKQWADRKVDLLVWVNAGSRDAIIAAFGQAAAEVCGADPAGGEHAAQRFLAWLDRPDTPRWLIVLDDLTAQDDLIGLWPPANRNGRTVITTRRRDAALDGAGRARTDVGMFSPEEAADFLGGRLRHDSRRLEGAAALAEDLGHLPLALAQAAAYILDMPSLNCEAYRERLADRTTKLADLSPRAIPDDYRRSAAAALSLAVERADPDYPNGMPTRLLELASMVEPNGIPTGFYLHQAASRYFQTTTSSTGLSPRTAIANETEAVLSRLHRLSLLNWDGETVDVHSLVQRIVRDWFSPERHRRMAVVAADCLELSWQRLDLSAAVGAVLRASAARLRAEHDELLFEGGMHPLLMRIGISLGKWGRTGEAAAYFEALTALGEARLGRDDPDTLAAQVSHGSVLSEAHDFSGAVRVFDGLLERMVRVHGPTDIRTLWHRADLARLSGQMGFPDRAVEQYTSIVADAEDVLGAADAQVLKFKAELVGLRESAGAAADAAMTEDVRVEFERRSAESETAFSLRSSSANRLGADDPSAAVAALESLLSDMEDVFAPEYPNLFRVRSNLARWRGEAGDPARAAAELEVLVDDMDRALGAGHAQTIRVLVNLVIQRAEADDVEGAAAAFERFAADTEHAFGPMDVRTFSLLRVLFSRQGRARDRIAVAMLLGRWRFVVSRTPAPSDSEDGTRRSECVAVIRQGERRREISVGPLPVAYHDAMTDVLGRELAMRTSYRETMRGTSREGLEGFLALTRSGEDVTPESLQRLLRPDPDTARSVFEEFSGLVRRIAPELRRIAETAAVAGVPPRASGRD